MQNTSDSLNSQLRYLATAGNYPRPQNNCRYVFEIIANVANSVNALFFVVGATARDMILIHGYGIEPKRGREDIDFGIQVSDWDQFKKLKNGLIATEKFSLTKNPQI
jgi:predicted nucleotidyltransferase